MNWSKWKIENERKYKGLVRFLRGAGKVVVVDFDGVLVEHRFPAIGKLNVEVKDFCARSQAKGIAIVISSSRNFKGWPEEDPYFREMVEFIISEGILHTWIDTGDKGKVPAITYIDDHAFNFDGRLP